jgi:protein required for attachment to host cells
MGWAFNEGMKKQLHQINPLVLVADSARAQFFTLESESKQLVERSTFVNGAARLRDQDLTAGDRGRSFDSRGGGRHGMEPSSGAKESAVQAFAEEVAKQVPEQLSDCGARQLILVAAPKFLGLLRKVLPADAKNALYFEIDADFTTHAANEITEAVNRRLREDGS